jgi:peptide/nickel transport system ATP-binding protein/oligopeptide transport system ATP-binding protein
MLTVRNLRTWFPIRTGILRRHTGDVKAVDDVSFEIEEGTTVGLVGESGSGKTTIGRTILKLTPATSGQILFRGRDILAAYRIGIPSVAPRDADDLPGPVRLLNPGTRFSKSSAKRSRIHFPQMTRSDREARVAELLTQVGLKPEMRHRYPHEFSGGQRQRIGIARALAVKPKFIVCDEPVSALDVSVQAQIVNLLQDLQEELGLTYLFIAHDLAVVEHVSDPCARDVSRQNRGERQRRCHLRESAARVHEEPPRGGAEIWLKQSCFTPCEGAISQLSGELSILSSQFSTSPEHAPAFEEPGANPAGGRWSSARSDRA